MRDLRDIFFPRHFLPVRYMKAKQSGLLTNTKADPAFTTKSYNNWKNALDKKSGFYKQSNNDSHKEAILRQLVAPSNKYKKTPSMLSESFDMHQIQNRKMLLKLISSIRYPSKPLRGKTELNSNFRQQIN